MICESLVLGHHHAIAPWILYWKTLALGYMPDVEVVPNLVRPLVQRGGQAVRDGQGEVSDGDC